MYLSIYPFTYSFFQESTRCLLGTVVGTEGHKPAGPLSTSFYSSIRNSTRKPSAIRFDMVVLMSAMLRSWNGQCGIMYVLVRPSLNSRAAVEAGISCSSNCQKGRNTDSEAITNKGFVVGTFINTSCFHDHDSLY